MRAMKVWRRLLGVEGAVVEDVDFDEEQQAVVATVRVKYRYRNLCPHCRRRCAGYDAGEGPRRWRALDLGVTRAYLEAEAPRVWCSEHGVVVAAVPWARHGARSTRYFEDQTAWLATHTNKTAVSSLMRISWRAVGRIVERVGAEVRARVDCLANLRRIGIDEISYRKGHRYLTVVVDHDSGRLVWAHPGKDAQALRTFFDALGPERAARIELVSCDAAQHYVDVVEQRCPKATICFDPFHVVKWASAALDAVRRKVWNDLRHGGQRDIAFVLKRSRYALWKNPENLTEKQARKLSVIASVNKPLYRAYLLKEQLREVFKLRGARGIALLDAWLAWACRSRLAAFVEAGRTIRRHREGIVAALEHGLSNARVESMNTKLRLLMRVAFGFHSAAPLIALALFKLGGLCPDLPGRV